ncbi:hypothetical protein ACH5RR_037860 [Cinchona calisaya]|uniref:Uncharacterized protein n=1 Tax=Cinchona calisaya TaxID=153742 RepID=A0ABD2Y9Q7_9GENT
MFGGRGPPSSPPKTPKNLKIFEDIKVDVHMELSYPLGGDRDDEPPYKKLKFHRGRGILNLRQQYIEVLNSMLQYQAIFGVVPNANSDEFYRFLHGGKTQTVSRQNLTQAILFMEESFQRFVRERGRNPHFLNPYLEERFRLSELLWGAQLLDHQEPNDNLEGEEEKAVVENVLGDHQGGEVNQGQDAMDIAILRIIFELRTTNNNGRNPEPDSDELYNFLVNLGAIGNMQQDELVDRILLLEENYHRIESNNVGVLDFGIPSRQEIYNLSNMIWHDPNRLHVNIDLDDDDDQGGAENIDVLFGADDHQNIGNDELDLLEFYVQGGDDENIGNDEHVHLDDQGGGENNGGADEQDDQGGVEEAEEDDLGDVED